MAKKFKKKPISVSKSSFVNKKQNSVVKKTPKDEKKKSKNVRNKYKNMIKKEEEDVLLRDVIDLGGKKSDLKLLRKPKKTKNGDAKELDKKELDQFCKDLGFDDIPEEEKNFSVFEPSESKPKENIVENKEEVDTPEIHVLKLSRDTKIQCLPKKCLIKKPYMWHEIFCDSGEGLDEKSREAIWLHELADKYLENEVNQYKEFQTKRKTDSDTNHVWLQTAITSGTLSDKIAALSLTMNEAPVHSLTSFDSLLSICQKKEKRVSFIGLDAIKTLFLSDLIPENRRLKPFYKQPLKKLAKHLIIKDFSGDWSYENCKIRLILWAFEDKLKKLVSSFVGRIRELSHDCLEASKLKAMKYALELLKMKPEQEKALLDMIVDKLGDPKYKVASKALHMLNGLIMDHPLMQAIVIDAVRHLLLTPNISTRSLYYCVCFLNSQILSEDRKEIAQKLVEIYINFFKAFTKKKIQPNDKMLSALLTGISRAFPFANMKETAVMEEINILFRTVHVTNISTSVRALMLLSQVFTSREEVSDRFYSALYATLLHPDLPRSTSRHPMFLNLLFRSVKNDPCNPRVEAMLKRLLQTCSLQQSPYAAASLVLVAEICRLRPEVAYSFLTSRTEEAGCLDADDEDEEEHFTDVKGDSDVEENEKTNEDKEVKAAWVHQHKDAMRKKSGQKLEYNPSQRNPQFASAEKTSMWELHTLTRHFHPSVKVHAENILNKETETASKSGDPLEDHTLIKFLDRFVYRNPKTSVKKLASLNVSIHQRKNKKFSQNITPVNSSQFLNKQHLNPEDIFFHKYFSSLAQINSQHPNKKKKVKEIETLSDDEFEDFVASAQGQKEIDTVLNFADHVYKRPNLEDQMEESDDDEEDLEEDEDFKDAEFDDDVEDFEDAIFDDDEGDEDFEAAMIDDEAVEVSSDDNEEIKPQESVIDDADHVEDFNEMIASNTHDEFVLFIFLSLLHFLLF